MIIKKDVSPETLILLINFLRSPEAILTQEEAGEMIRDGSSWSSSKPVVRFKGDIKPEGKTFSVVVEIDDKYDVRDGRSLTQDLPGHFFVDLMKTLGYSPEPTNT